MPQIISRTYRDVTWRDIQTKDGLNAQILVNYDDGGTHIFEATIGKSDDLDSDWVAIMEKFTVEQIDEATTVDIQERIRLRDEDNALKAEQDKKNAEFSKQEMIFAAKLESFEIPLVKNSTNRELKALIRKSKTLGEINAYTTILIMKELENASIQQETPTEEPPAE